MAASLRIAIVHYHLRAGGVTRVISSAAKALTAKGHQVAILAGDIPQGFSAPEGVSVKKIPRLDYALTFNPASVDALDGELCRAAFSALGMKPDVWHFHNHSLGKNLSLLPLMGRWAERGEAMLLQIHDFAENGRPENYARLLKAAGGRKQLGKMLYPASSRIRYAVLNHRDLKILQEAGAGDWVSVLPNPVEMSPASIGEFSPAQLGAQAFTFYPCRPLGRKNIGEALLWSFCFPLGEKLVFPVAPDNPAERDGYARWKAVADSLHLPVEFEVIDRFDVSVETLAAASRRVLTTSVMEGFGMAFLEPWLIARQLVGRKLPEITADFSNEGINLDHLYESLPIPLAWIGKDRALKQLEVALQSFGSLYQFPVPFEWMKKQKDDFQKNGVTDFGFLSEDLQREVLQALSQSEEMKKEIPLDLLRDSAFTEKNAKAVRQGYSPEVYATRVERLYSEAANAGAGAAEHLDGDAILRGNLRAGLAMALRTAPSANPGA